MKQEIILQIDDAGYGNFVGGLVVGGYSSVDDAYFGIEISLDTLNTEGVDPQDEVLNAVKRIMRYFSKKYIIKEVYMCRSNLFDKVEEYFDEKRKKISLWRGVIEGPLQEKIENHFINTLIELGLPGYVKFFLKVIRKNKNLGYKLLNNFCINYIKIDLKNRLQLCKQNSKLFKRLKKTEIITSIVPNLTRKKSHLCFNCGYYIKEKEIVRYYEKDKKNYFYTHFQCVDEK